MPRCRERRLQICVRRDGNATDCIAFGHRSLARRHAGIRRRRTRRDREGSVMSETQNPEAARSPVVYFIDDSATMREVIKIAFRKEDIHVVACHNAASAIAQFEQTPPDAVITDVIMPDQDGYEVCQFVKSHPQFRSAPVILMSGVVNRSV